MSLQTETPSGAGSLASFWSTIRGSRRRADASPPPPLRRDRLRKRDVAATAAGNPAAAARTPRRSVITAERLAESYVPGLAVGEYRFRDLKNEFDAYCEEAELASVTDKRFAMWLQEHGAVRYRIAHAKVTMYRISRRGAA
jgi:hypothetical protein